MYRQHVQGLTIHGWQRWPHRYYAWETTSIPLETFKEKFATQGRSQQRHFQRNSECDPESHDPDEHIRNALDQQWTLPPTPQPRPRSDGRLRP
jgi:hypothetical protein